MKKTENYNLNLPEGNDVVNIDDLSSNFEIIDEKIKETEDLLNEKVNLTEKELEEIKGKIEEVKTEVIKGYEILNSSTYGNNVIKSKVDSTYTQASNAYSKANSNYNILNSSSYGNSAIKNKIDSTYTKANDTYNKADSNYNILNNSTYGNSAMKNKLDNTYAKASDTYNKANLSYNILNSSSYGNSAIKSKVDSTYTKASDAQNIASNSYSILNSGIYGNSAINTKINNIMTRLEKLEDNQQFSWIDNSKISKLKFIDIKTSFTYKTTEVTTSNASSLLKTVLNVSGAGKIFYILNTGNENVRAIRVTVDGEVFSFISAKSGGTNANLLKGVADLGIYPISFVRYMLPGKYHTTGLEPDYKYYIPSSQLIQHTMSVGGMTAITEPIKFKSSFKVELYDGLKESYARDNLLYGVYQLD